MMHQDFIFNPAKIANAKNGRVYWFLPADQVRKNPKIFAQMVEICNESLIYETLFRKMLNGFPYTERLASDFIDFAHHGWEKHTHFVFFILDQDENLVGCCDIKSNNLEEAEIGYWLSQDHSGIMSNVIEELKTQAFATGFKKLSAFCTPNNTKSQEVLKRCLLNFVSEVSKDGRALQKYTTTAPRKD